jgi:hypothetical protein
MMRRKSFSIFGVILLISLFFLQSCQSKPETKVLQRFFTAVKLNDKTTMGTMAMEPISPEFVSWEITASGEDMIEPYILPDLNIKELGLKKKVEESVIITMNAKDEMDDALFEMENARTTSARRALRKKVDELQAKYEEIRKTHDQLQVDYSAAQAASAKEEEIANFSLGAGDVPNIRELSGNVHSKDVEIKVALVSGGVKNYNCILMKYDLRDETLNLPRRGMWKILRFEELD